MPQLIQAIAFVSAHRAHIMMALPRPTYSPSTGRTNERTWHQFEPAQRQDFHSSGRQEAQKQTTKSILSRKFIRADNDRELCVHLPSSRYLPQADARVACQAAGGINIGDRGNNDNDNHQIIGKRKRVHATSAEEQQHDGTTSQGW
eukprot:CAMPEP_0183703236 /NCGR_PEP_ID=MMETSP0737-20130205/1052_1 /TAXON_ID=385413 /ORGANISM="Thalassiosira miniscula, Strain CCMP1093" /LENGTH=145 /DNA_ID=CAMNT_0025929955 /DNA_START=342 /DNA_END=776 /DNA_ORIENTATION=-